MSEKPYRGKIIAMKKVGDMFLPEITEDIFMSGEMPRFLPDKVVGAGRTFYELLSEYSDQIPTAREAYDQQRLLEGYRFDQISLRVPEGQKPDSHITDSRGRKFYPREVVNLGDGRKLGDVYVPAESGFVMPEYDPRFSLPDITPDKKSE